MKATDAYRKINNSPIKGIVLYYTEQLKKENGSSKIKDVISDIQTGKTPPKANPKYYASEDINWFKPSDIGYGKYLVNAKEKFSTIALKEKKGTLYPANTMLIIGIGGGVGRVSILKESGSSNQQITGITFKENINPEYAYYYFLVREDYIKSLAKSMSFPILNQENLKGLDFSFPEINEQNEFVKFVDECLNCFVNGIEPDFSNFSINEDLKEYALKQFKIINQFDTFSIENETQNNTLSQLRQSILQEAIQGKLTEKWRSENKNTEPASELLKRIKSEKEKTAKKGKISSLSEISESEIPFDLPQGWVWCRLGEIAQSLIGLTYKPTDISEKGTPVLRSNNIQESKLVLSDLVKVSSEVPLSKMAQKGDILICVRNGSKRLIGKVAKIDADGFSFGAFMSVLRTGIDTNYLFTFLLSDVFRNQIDDEKSTGINQLTQGILNNIVFPLPPTEEQQAIVTQVEVLLDKCNALQAEIESLNTNSKTLLKALFNETFATETV